VQISPGRPDDLLGEPSLWVERRLSSPDVELIRTHIPSTPLFSPLELLGESCVACDIHNDGIPRSRYLSGEKVCQYPATWLNLAADVISIDDEKYIGEKQEAPYHADLDLQNSASAKYAHPYHCRPPTLTGLGSEILWPTSPTRS
jgi:hypothetical protein